MYLTKLYTTTMCTEMLTLVLVFGKNASFTYCLNMETRLSRIINTIKELNLVVMFYIYGNESTILQYVTISIFLKLKMSTMKIVLFMKNQIMYDFEDYI